MIRKILLSLLLLAVLAIGGLFTLLATNSDIIIDKFHSYIENNTGAPLVSQTRPVFTLLPNRGLELGASSWQKPDKSLSISFSRASVLISSHDLFVGRFSIKNFTVEDLKITMKLDRPLSEYIFGLADNLEKRRNVDEIVRFLLDALTMAPDTINVHRGSICLVEPSGNNIVLSPLSFEADNVHPGSRTEFSLKTEVFGSEPSFKVSAELACSALFSKQSASFTVKTGVLKPVEGLPFSEDVTLAGSLGYDYKSSAFNFSSLELKGPSLSLKASGGINSLADFYYDPQKGGLSASIDIAGEPQELGALFGISQPFSSVALKADLLWKDGKLDLKSMSGKADSFTFTGGIQTSFLPFAITGDLHFTELDIASFKDNSSSEGSGDGSEKDFNRWPRVSLSIGAGTLIWDRLILENVNLRMNGQNGTYELNPLTATLAGSPVIASLKAVMLPTSPLSARIGLNFSAPQAELADICQLLLKQNLLKGKGAVNASLSFTTSRGLPSLSGTGSITSTSVQTSFDVLPSRIPVASFLSPGNNFDKLLLYFKAKEGLIDVQDFTLEAPRFALNGKGRLDLPERSVDASGSMRLGGSTVLPVRLRGSMKNPKYSLDLRSNAKPASLDITLDGDFAKKIDDIIGASR